MPVPSKLVSLLGTSFVFWLMQAVSMQVLVVNRSRWSIAVALGIFLWGTYSLGGLILDEQNGHFNPDTSLLWVPFAMQIIRFVHALSVGGTKFADTFGLTSFWRVAAFTLLVPTVIFYNDPSTLVMGTKANSRAKGLWILCRGILYFILFVSTNAAIVELSNLGYVDSLPWWLERILSVCIFANATALNDLIFNAPTRLLIGSNAVIIDICDNPLLISSPRDIWRRWTLCAGYHLRKGFYEPLGGNSNSVVATMVPFAVNSGVHVFWWSVVTTGTPNFEFMYPLVLLPFTTLILDEHIFGPKGLFGWNRDSWQYKLIGYLQLLIVMVAMCPCLLRMMHFPKTLKGLALKNVGRPIEE